MPTPLEAHMLHRGNHDSNIAALMETNKDTEAVSFARGVYKGMMSEYYRNMATLKGVTSMSDVSDEYNDHLEDLNMQGSMSELIGGSLASAGMYIPALAASFFALPGAVAIATGIAAYQGISAGYSNLMNIWTHEKDTGEEVSALKKIATTAGYASTAFILEKLGMHKVDAAIKNIAPSAIYRIGAAISKGERSKVPGLVLSSLSRAGFTGALSEGLQEGAEQVVNNATDMLWNFRGDVLKSLTNEVDTAILGGAIGGAFLSGTGALGYATKMRIKPTRLNMEEGSPEKKIVNFLRDTSPDLNQEQLETGLLTLKIISEAHNMDFEHVLNNVFKQVQTPEGIIGTGDYKFSPESETKIKELMTAYDNFFTFFNNTATDKLGKEIKSKRELHFNKLLKSGNVEEFQKNIMDDFEHYNKQILDSDYLKDKVSSLCTDEERKLMIEGFYNNVRELTTDLSGYETARHEGNANMAKLLNIQRKKQNKTEGKLVYFKPKDIQTLLEANGLWKKFTKDKDLNNLQREEAASKDIKVLETLEDGRVVVPNTVIRSKDTPGKNTIIPIYSTLEHLYVRSLIDSDIPVLIAPITDNLYGKLAEAQDKLSKDMLIRDIKQSERRYRVLVSKIEDNKLIARTDASLRDFFRDNVEAKFKDGVPGFDLKAKELEYTDIGGTTRTIKVNLLKLRKSLDPVKSALIASEEDTYSKREDEGRITSYALNKALENSLVGTEEEIKEAKESLAYLSSNISHFHAKVLYAAYSTSAVTLDSENKVATVQNPTLKIRKGNTNNYGKADAIFGIGKALLNPETLKTQITQSEKLQVSFSEMARMQKLYDEMSPAEREFFGFSIAQKNSVDMKKLYDINRHIFNMEEATSVEGFISELIKTIRPYLPESTQKRMQSAVESKFPEKETHSIYDEKYWTEEIDAIRDKNNNLIYATTRYEKLTANLVAWLKDQSTKPNKTRADNLYGTLQTTLANMTLSTEAGSKLPYELKTLFDDLFDIPIVFKARNKEGYEKLRNIRKKYSGQHYHTGQIVSLKDNPDTKYIIENSELNSTGDYEYQLKQVNNNGVGLEDTKSVTALQTQVGELVKDTEIDRIKDTKFVGLFNLIMSPHAGLPDNSPIAKRIIYKMHEVYSYYENAIGKSEPMVKGFKDEANSIIRNRLGKNKLLNLKAYKQEELRFNKLFRRYYELQMTFSKLKNDLAETNALYKKSGPTHRESMKESMKTLSDSYNIAKEELWYHTNIMKQAYGDKDYKTIINLKDKIINYFSDTQNAAKKAKVYEYVEKGKYKLFLPDNGLLPTIQKKIATIMDNFASYNSSQLTESAWREAYTQIDKLISDDVISRIDNYEVKRKETITNIMETTEQGEERDAALAIEEKSFNDLIDLTRENYEKGIKVTLNKVRDAINMAINWGDNFYAPGGERGAYAIRLTHKYIGKIAFTNDLGQRVTETVGGSTPERVQALLDKRLKTIKESKNKNSKFQDAELVLFEGGKTFRENIDMEGYTFARAQTLAQAEDRIKRLDTREVYHKAAMNRLKKQDFKTSDELYAEENLDVGLGDKEEGKILLSRLGKKRRLKAIEIDNATRKTSHIEANMSSEPETLSMVLKMGRLDQNGNVIESTMTDSFDEGLVGINKSFLADVNTDFYSEEGPDLRDVTIVRADPFATDNIQNTEQNLEHLIGDEKFFDYLIDYNNSMMKLIHLNGDMKQMFMELDTAEDIGANDKYWLKDVMNAVMIATRSSLDLITDNVFTELDPSREKMTELFNAKIDKAKQEAHAKTFLGKMFSMGFDKSVLDDIKSNAKSLGLEAKDRIKSIPYLLSGGRPGRSQKLSSLVRRVESAAKIGYKPVTVMLNKFYGMGHLYLSVGSEYISKAHEFINTTEGKMFLYEEQRHLGQMLGVDIEGNAKKKVSPFHPLAWFQHAENQMRTVGIAANYLFFREKGDILLKSKAEAGEATVEFNDLRAREEARQAVRMQFFTYSILSMPKILRSSTMKMILLFKSFIGKEVEFFAKLPAKKKVEYLGATLLFGGTKGMLGLLTSIPFLGWVIPDDWFEDLLGNTEEYNILTQGVFSAAGIDIAENVSFRFPTSLEDFFGPVVMDAYKLYNDVVKTSLAGEYGVIPTNLKELRQGTGLTEYIENAVPFLRNAHKGVEAALTMKTFNRELGKHFKDGYLIDAKGRKSVKIEHPYLDAIKYAIGAKPSSAGSQKDALWAVQERNIKSSKIINSFYNKVRKEYAAYKRLSKSTVLEGMRLGLSTKDLHRAIAYGALTPERRLRKQTRKRDKPEVERFFQ